MHSLAEVPHLTRKKKKKKLELKRAKMRVVVFLLLSFQFFEKLSASEDVTNAVIVKVTVPYHIYKSVCHIAPSDQQISNAETHNTIENQHNLAHHMHSNDPLRIVVYTPTDLTKKQLEKTSLSVLSNPSHLDFSPTLVMRESGHNFPNDYPITKGSYITFCFYRVPPNISTAASESCDMAIDLLDILSHPNSDFDEVKFIGLNYETVPEVYVDGMCSEYPLF